MSVSGRLPRRLRWLAMPVLLLVVAFFAWQHYFPVVAAGGWTSEVYLDDVAMVSGLEVGGDGVLYITQEFARKQGNLLKRSSHGGIEGVLSGFDKPDGLTSYRDGILLSQEGGDRPVLWVHGGRVEELFRGDNIEGLDADATHVFAIEDMKSAGRLLQYDIDTGRTTVLRTGLIEAEGVAVCPDGSLFYSEKEHGWVKQYRPGLDDLVVQRGLRKPGFLKCNADGLWIAEDATHGARLLLADASGAMHVVLSHLRAAQAVLAAGKDRYLVAEQGRGRILEINRQRGDET